MILGATLLAGSTASARALECSAATPGWVSGWLRGGAPPEAVLGAAEARGWIAGSKAAAAWIGIEAGAGRCRLPQDLARPRSRGRAGTGSGCSGQISADGPRFLALLAGTWRTCPASDARLPGRIRIATGAILSALCRDAEASVAKDVDRIVAEISVRPSRRQGVRAVFARPALSRCSRRRRLAASPGRWCAPARSRARVGITAVLRPAPGGRCRCSGSPPGSAPPGGSWVGYLRPAARILAGSWPGYCCSCRASRAASPRRPWAAPSLSRRGRSSRAACSSSSLGASTWTLPAVRESAGSTAWFWSRRSIEQLGRFGGSSAPVGAPELILAVAVLALGAGGRPHAAWLVATIVLTLWLAWRYGSARRRWTESRLAMTNALIERMIGHRTRLAQEPPARSHEDEDQVLERYLEPSQQLDHLGASLLVLVPRGWLLVGLLGLAPAFVSGNTPPATMAIGLGGVLLAYQALRTLTEAVEGIAAATIAWRLLRPLLTATVPRQRAGHPDYAVPSPPAITPASRRPRLDARDLGFGYRDRDEPVLRGASLCISDGARILLRGPSGGGKSTLVALLAGLRAPDSGLLLWDGLDLATLGVDGWRQRVALAPQFHENHVLMGTFAFNLLMGRGWPPRPADLEEAESVCRALALGPLLDRMPSGIHQVLGETGWQLSHGERSRLYLARALLQGADLIILDESFAALDPATLREVFAYVLRQRPALVVVAHP